MVPSAFRTICGWWGKASIVARPDGFDAEKAAASLDSPTLKAEEREEALRREIQALREEVADLSRLNDRGWRWRQADSLSEGLAEVLAATIDLLGADMGGVQLVDDDAALRIVAQRGFKRDLAELFPEVRIDEETACARAFRSGKPVIVEDTELDGAFAPYRDAARDAGFRAVVSVPLIGRHGITIGILSTHFLSPHRPGDADMRRLGLYADRAAAFIERIKSDAALRDTNARLIAEKIATAKFYEGGLQVLRAQSLSEALDIMISRCLDMLGADMGIIQLLDGDGRLLHVAVQQGFTQEVLDRFLEFSAADDSARSRALRSGKTVVIEDVDSDETYASFRELSHWAGYRAIIVAPLVGRHGIQQGIMLLHYRSPHLPTDTDLEHLELYRRRGGDFIEYFRAEEARRVLVAELQHRTRNLMAVVQSIAHQTLDNVESLADFENRFNRRLDALSRVQSLLSRAGEEPITLATLVVGEFEALAPDAVGERITVQGPRVRLRNSTVEMLALAIHELLTNAIKYGAFSGADGRLRLAWRVDGTGPNFRLVLEWTEHDVEHLPASGDAKRRGYGRTLIEEALPYSLSAETKFEFGADGFRCRICLPLAPSESGEFVV